MDQCHPQELRCQGRAAVAAAAAPVLHHETNRIQTVLLDSTTDSSRELSVGAKAWRNEKQVGSHYNNAGADYAGYRTLGNNPALSHFIVKTLHKEGLGLTSFSA